MWLLLHGRLPLRARFARLHIVAPQDNVSLFFKSQNEDISHFSSIAPALAHFGLESPTYGFFIRLSSKLADPFRFLGSLRHVC